MEPRYNEFRTMKLTLLYLGKKNKKNVKCLDQQNKHIRGCCTGWPRKNATPTITNLKEIGD